mmetsp:Transcript_36302/g.56719  ORF Transcript_36302/g.56719 Transcript_36302/m.56719 type:complete len:86 (+) Transcript_36302:66-323(+)
MLNDTDSGDISSIMSDLPCQSGVRCTQLPVIRIEIRFSPLCLPSAESETLDEGVEPPGNVVAMEEEGGWCIDQEYSHSNAHREIL